jgi:hypothetical protein
MKTVKSGVIGAADCLGISIITGFLFKSVRIYASHLENETIRRRIMKTVEVLETVLSIAG